LVKLLPFKAPMAQTTMRAELAAAVVVALSDSYS